MTPPKTYKIATIQDILDLPPDAMERCLDGLKEALVMVRQSIDFANIAADAFVGEAIPSTEGPIFPTPFEFEWVDDGLQDTTTSFYCEGAELLAIEMKSKTKGAEGKIQ